MRQDIKYGLKYGACMALPWMVIGAIQIYETSDWNYMIQFGILAIGIGAFGG